MDLREYLIKYGIKQTIYAAMCGTSTATINNIIRGRKKANVPLALRIELKSDGKIDPRKLVASWNVEKLLAAKRYDKQ